MGTTHIGPRAAPAARGGAREGAQEPYGLGGGEFGAQVEADRYHLGLGEAAQPAVGQRHLLLHDRAVQGGDGQLVGADPQVQRVVSGEPGKRLAQRVVDVDVGGAVAGVGPVEAALEHIEAGVHAAASGEGLEPQPVAVAGDHRVQRGPQGALVVAGGGDVGDGQQPPGRGLGRGQEPGEEPGMGLGPDRGEPPAVSSPRSLPPASEVRVEERA